MSCEIVAEIGINFEGSTDKLLAFAAAAKACGASACKIQAFDADKLISRRGIKVNDRFHDGRLLVDVLRQSAITDDQIDGLALWCRQNNYRWLASVFSPDQVERVLSRGACALKIGHKEAKWKDLVRSCICREGVEVYISNGTYGDDPERSYHNVRSIHCVDEYPAHKAPELCRVIDGFSSHYTDYRIPAAAALRGAEYIEFHLKLSDADPEAAWSLSVEDATKCCALIREFSSWL